MYEIQSSWRLLKGAIPSAARDLAGTPFILAARKILGNPRSRRVGSWIEDYFFAVGGNRPFKRRYIAAVL